VDRITLTGAGGIEPADDLTAVIVKRDVNAKPA
jgi:hypothetical protein